MRRGKMVRSKKLLFFGELPPDSIHGVALANDVNINILKATFNIDVVQEFSNLTDHNKISLGKFLINLYSLLYHCLD